MKIYLVRHGKTMFNTIGRAQGWSDTPLTDEGELGITELGLGFKARGVTFERAYSSDSGRTIQTMGLILKHSENEEISYTFDKRIREWCFGSFDGGYDGDLFDGVLPVVFTRNGKGTDVWEQPLSEICQAIYDVDTAGWAETWEELSGRILEGFHAIAEEAEAAGAENIVIVSHGMTIGTFIHLLRPYEPRPRGLDNGCVSELTYEKGVFHVETCGDMSYRELGREKLALD
ncbi:MAG: phosphoglycerate mutase family protein [Streptococcaceae bacterium]|jgi:probable phosphoglycerate mutase|nr:phosphoglycerate mutase family protein [Streptococcaceae bacterium]